MPSWSISHKLPSPGTLIDKGQIMNKTSRQRPIQGQGACRIEANRALAARARFSGSTRPQSPNRRRSAIRAAQGAPASSRRRGRSRASLQGRSRARPPAKTGSIECSRVRHDPGSPNRRHLLPAEDEVDPVVQVRRDVLALQRLPRVAAASLSAFCLGSIPILEPTMRERRGTSTAFDGICLSRVRACL